MKSISKSVRRLASYRIRALTLIGRLCTQYTYFERINWPGNWRVICILTCIWIMLTWHQRDDSPVLPCSKPTLDPNLYVSFKLAFLYSGLRLHLNQWELDLNSHTLCWVSLESSGRACSQGRDKTLKIGELSFKFILAFIVVAAQDKFCFQLKIL